MTHMSAGEFFPPLSPKPNWMQAASTSPPPVEAPAVQ